MAKLEEFRMEIDNNFYDNEINNRASGFLHRARPIPRKHTPKPELKCHFCNLKYCIEEERKEHEEFWHSDKIKKPSTPEAKYT